MKLDHAAIRFHDTQFGADSSAQSVPTRTDVPRTCSAHSKEVSKWGYRYKA